MYVLSLKQNITKYNVHTIFFADINQSMPMVAWSKIQESGLQTETFMLLLHKLGFHLANDVGKCFPRIPHFWSGKIILYFLISWDFNE